MGFPVLFSGPGAQPFAAGAESRPGAGHSRRFGSRGAGCKDREGERACNLSPCAIFLCGGTDGQEGRALGNTPERTQGRQRATVVEKTVSSFGGTEVRLENPKLLTVFSNVRRRKRGSHSGEADGLLTLHCCRSNRFRQLFQSASRRLTAAR